MRLFMTLALCTALFSAPYRANAEETSPQAPVEVAKEEPPVSPPIAEPPAPTATKIRSVGMRNAGIALTVLGGVSIGTGVTMIAVDSNGDDVAVVAFIGILVTAFGGVSTAVGVPLWVAGASEVPARGEKQSRRLVPQVSIGSRSATLRWTF